MSKYNPMPILNAEQTLDGTEGMYAY